MRVFSSTKRLPRAGFGQADLERHGRDEGSCLAALLIAPPEYSGGALEEDTGQFHSTIDFGTIDKLTALVENLSADEVDILHLAANGYSESQICWLLNKSSRVVADVIFKGEGLIGADFLARAGLLTSMRQSTLENRYARHLAKLLMGLVDARIMRVIVNETHCGLHVLLATGKQVKLWLCADDELERPGWASLESIDGDFVYEDEMHGLATQVASFIGRGRTSTETAKEILRDIAERAIGLLDEFDGDCDLESNGDWEAEVLEDQDEVPTTLNPLHQAKRKISVARPKRAPSKPHAIATGRSFGADVTRFPNHDPFTSGCSNGSEVRIPDDGNAVAESMVAAQARNSRVGEELHQLRSEDIEQEKSVKLARLVGIMRDVSMAPARDRARTRIWHDKELLELDSWLRRHGVDLGLNSPIWNNSQR